MDETKSPRGEEPEPSQEVPLFGTWRAIYAAVILVALACLGLLTLFSRWPY